MFKFRRERLLSAGTAVLVASLWFGVGARAAQADAGSIDADVHKALDNKKFANVTASLHGPEVVLTGTVDTYAVKMEADKSVRHVKGVKGVDNEIRVAGPTVEDAELRDKLAKALSYDRVGYGTAPFNALTIGVHDGVVTLGGTVYGPPDKDSALGLVGNTPGVKDIVDNIQVAPVSPMDDRLRVELERVIYGAPQLQKYALDPEKPIRITVINGNVTLTGVVDNKMDHDVAGIRANTVPGVFKVVNDLQIASPQASK
ncbi:MAG: BON domain-containing protein [Acidobacteriaceae bacterium]